MKTVIAAALVVAILSGGFWYRHHVCESGYAAGAALQFVSWTQDNGKVVAGLTRRRQSEADLFVSEP